MCVQTHAHHTLTPLSLAFKIINLIDWFDKLDFFFFLLPFNVSPVSRSLRVAVQVEIIYIVCWVKYHKRTLFLSWNSIRFEVPELLSPPATTLSNFIRRNELCSCEEYKLPKSQMNSNEIWSYFLWEFHHINVSFELDFLFTGNRLIRMKWEMKIVIKRWWQISYSCLFRSESLSSEIVSKSKLMAFRLIEMYEIIEMNISMEKSR